MSQLLSRVRNLVRTRPIHHFSLRKKVVLSQLPLTLATLLSCLLALAVDPDRLFKDPFFASGVASVAAITVLSWVVPWGGELRDPRWHLVLPALNLFAVMLIGIGTFGVLNGMSLFLAFPVFWLAWSGYFPRTTLAIALVFPLAAIWLQVWHSGRGLTPINLMRPMMIPIVIFALAVTTVLIEAGRMSKDRELGAALDSSRQQAALLDAVLNAVSVGVVVVDRDGNDMLMNELQRQQHRSGIPQDNPDPTEAQMLLFGSDEAGRPLPDPLPADQRPVRRAILGQEFSNQLFWAGETGRQRAFNASARSLRDSQGEHSGSVVIFNDVSDVMDALNTKDAFLSSVSHELRTPLTSIIGYLELVADDPELPAAAAGHLAVATRNSNRLLHLVNDLLTSASVLREIRFTDMDLSETVLASIESARPHAAVAGIELVSELPAMLVALADPLRVAQIADNLISNALKYTCSGGTVTVSLEAGPEQAVLRVRDTGRGMNPDELALLFTRFYRTDSARRAAVPGAGLGLSITRELVAAHHGQIEVASAPGVGSTFTVHLPLRSAELTVPA
ncbi:sensor histidine kinase [Paeniglutamicibacter cryotolerans]|uniref:histidine kinase n=1 Tax=Paeniglutamicibacter cryotolerans TaxID=670079 RepID=A0A839QT35_9MICC|nr:PAS domain-containing sensor histidine kinase [Paeniglutamicibacter cryotolerans]MBB2995201.1 signal transduction histidine kinase [Paeniglutamicibacter cryotolerans]